MDPLCKPEVSDLIAALLSLETAEECRCFLEDVCTVKEILDMAQRLRAARMLASGCNYADIGQKTGMSTATISRVNKCLEYGSGGYRTVIDRLTASAPTDQSLES